MMKKRHTRKKIDFKLFDYESKVWGKHEVGLKPTFLGATRLKYALDALESIKKGKVLDVGCGGGAFARAIKKHRPELQVFGCDLSRKSIKLASKIGGGVSYSQANVYHLPFKNESFGAVVSFDVFEHLERPKEAADQVFKLLKTKGIFHLYVPTEGEKLSLYRLVPKWLYGAKKIYAAHLQSFTLPSLVKLLTDTGFNVKDIKKSSFYLYQIVDLGYFSFLRLRGRNVSQSVEGYLGSESRSLYKIPLMVLTKMFGVITYWENKVGKFLPPGGVHITAIKK